MYVYELFLLFKVTEISSFFLLLIVFSNLVISFVVVFSSSCSFDTVSSIAWANAISFKLLAFNAFFNRSDASLNKVCVFSLVILCSFFFLLVFFS